MTEKVFNKPLTIQLKTASQGDRSAFLNISVEILTSTAPLQKKSMYIQLTDNSDNFFLYTLRIDEEDFQSLKTNQGLLVDFPSFPQKLTELLNLCLSEEKKEIPKFILQLIMSDGYSTLNVVETNPFKHLIHLSLKVMPGNDSAIKTFLSECLRDYKERTERLHNELQSTESSLKTSLKVTEEALSSRNAELASMKMQWESRLSEIQAKNAHQINIEKEQSMKTQSQTQQRYQQEKRDLEQAHMKIVKQLEARVYELDTQNKELTESKFVNDASIRDLTAKVAVYEEEALKMRSDVQQLRKENTHLESELHKQEKTMNQLQTRIAVLEQQNDDKEKMISHSKELLQSEQAQKRLMEDEVTSGKSRFTQLDTNIKTLSDEVLKANEIIRKLQQDNKTIHAKLKLRSQIALKQEEVLKEKEKAVDSLESEMTTLQAQTKNQTAVTRELEAKLEVAHTEMEEQQKKLASNENVISWLNKQLDQVQIGRVRSTMGTHTTSLPTHTVSISQTTTSNPSRLHTSPPRGNEDSTPHHISKLPQPKYKSTPIIQPLEKENSGKENEPAIDAKYLPSVAAAPAVAPLKTRNWLSKASTDVMMPPVKTRISKDLINPHNALATAYFPHNQ